MIHPPDTLYGPSLRISIMQNNQTTWRGAPRGSCGLKLCMKQRLEGAHVLHIISLATTATTMATTMATRQTHMGRVQVSSGEFGVEMSSPGPETRRRRPKVPRDAPILNVSKSLQPLAALQDTTNLSVVVLVGLGSPSASDGPIFEYIKAAARA